MERMDWAKLLNGKRRKDKKKEHSGSQTASGRLEIERDFDRILFSTPVRRLSDKTQVFPLERNDSVRTRLTHSYEVSNLARSIGIRLAFDHAEEVFGPNHEELQVKRNVPSLLAAIGLAHDLGNPPFGHQGEDAMRHWFLTNKEKVGLSESEGLDFLKFDGNCQTFRLVATLQMLNDNYGLNLTYATLAAMLKYPIFSSSSGYKDKSWKKFGIFLSEKEIVHEVWKETGLKEGCRHPLTYIMEACDDIAYLVLDAEDTVKKGFASFYDVIDAITHDADGDSKICELVEYSKSKNQEFKKESLSPKELNDISMQMFRVKAISLMIDSVVENFVGNVDKILRFEAEPSLDLLETSSSNKLREKLKQFDREHGYNHKTVLKLELQGYNYLSGLMSMLWKGVSDDHDDPFSKYVYKRISESYRRVYERKSTDEFSETYKKAQLLCDFVSGMTDSYLIDIHDDLYRLQSNA